jgi:hypothetical protein
LGQRDRSSIIVPGQRDTLKILPRDSQNLEQAGTAKVWDDAWDKTGKSRKGRSKTGKGCSKTEKDVINRKGCSKTGK